MSQADFVVGAKLSKPAVDYWEKFTSLREVRFGFLQMSVIVLRKNVEILENSASLNKLASAQGISKGLKARIERGLSKIEEELDEVKEIKDRSANIEPVIREMLFADYINSFLYYIGGLIEEIYKKRPEMLKGCSITVGDVLKTNTHDEVVLSIANKLAGEVTRENIYKVSEKFNQLFGLQMCQSDNELKKLNEYFEIRNLIVHRNGIVDKLFLRKTETKNYEENQKIEVQNEELEELELFLWNIVSKLDNQAVRSHHLITYPN